MSRNLPNNDKSRAQKSDIFDDLNNNANIGIAVDNIFDTSKSLEEIQSKLILLMRKYMTDIYPNIKVKDFDEPAIINNITQISKNIFDNQLKKSHDENFSPETAAGEVNQYANISAQAKNNFKNQIKNFTVYEIYKVMNPRRIAGETKKDNYKHNMIMGGRKLAGRYEGGREDEINRYSQGFKDEAAKQAKQINKRSGLFRSR